ncbi:MAG TPA: hypothetical protein VGM33_11605 [Baekduia sp.]
MASKSKSKRFVSDAALQALVKFGPQLDVLKQAQRQATSQYSSQVAQADAGRIGVQQSVDAAVPQVARIYDDAGLDAARTSNTLIGHDLAGLSGVADSIKAGAAAEAAAMGGRLGVAKASALTDLADRRVAAASGAVTAKRQAQSSLVDNLAKILQSQQDLTGQKGTFEASALNDLIADDADRTQKTALNSADNSQSERNSLRSAGIDPDTGAPIPGGKLDPAAKKPKPKYASTDKHIEYASDIHQIASIATKYKGKASREQIVERLQLGRPQETLYVNENGDKVPEANKKDKGVQKVTRPSIPAFPADIRMAAALDVALDGHLSRKTQKELQRQHFKVKDLNLPTYGQWRAQNPPVSKKTRVAVKNAADTVQSLFGG